MSTDGPYPPLPDPSTLPHDSLVPNIIICAVVTWLIAAVFVALRFYTRTMILSVIGWSDWFIFISWVCSFGVTASAIEQSQRGIGRHVYDYDWLVNLTPFQKVSSHVHLSQNAPLYVSTDQAPTGGVVWRFVLHALLRLFQDLHAVAISQLIFVSLDKSRWEAGPCHGHTSDIVDALCCVHRLHTSGGILGVHPPCRGVLSATERVVGKCVSNFHNLRVLVHVPVTLQNGICDILVSEETRLRFELVITPGRGLHMSTDFLIFALPLPVLPTLRMPRRQKWMLTLVFSLGFL